jgi:hypothetical protein
MLEDPKPSTAAFSVLLEMVYGSIPDSILLVNDIHQ